MCYARSVRTRPTTKRRKHRRRGVRRTLHLHLPAKGATRGVNPKDLVGIRKPRLSLVAPASIIYEALAMQDGAKKYDPYNWRSNKVVASIYIDAALRHILGWWDGEEDAADSLVPHLAHAKACLGIIIDALETGNLVDDRPKPGAAARLLKKYTKRRPGHE